MSNSKIIRRGDKVDGFLWYQIMGFNETLVITKPVSDMSVVWNKPLQIYRHLYNK